MAAADDVRLYDALVVGMTSWLHDELSVRMWQKVQEHYLPLGTSTGQRFSFSDLQYPLFDRPGPERSLSTLLGRDGRGASVCETQCETQVERIEDLWRQPKQPTFHGIGHAIYFGCMQL